jgi:two-component system, NtrC family, sensor histidine kinase KinB
MKIKTKLTLGVGLLFILIILLAGVGTYYINALKSQTENILEANYNTLVYTRNMLMALDEKANVKFEKNLVAQQNNITELGEKEATEHLFQHFNQLKTNPTGTNLPLLIRKDISDIMMMNMQAIERKTNIAKVTANAATFWVAVAGALCFLIAFTLLVNLPSNISNPIKELTESIKQIANKNYHQRVHFEKHNEFGDLANSFNTMAEKLEEYNSSNLSELLFEKKRIETLINNMHEPVIGMDENKKILFVNSEALTIIGLTKDELIGKLATDVALNNDLIRSLIKDIFVPENPGNETSKPVKIFANNKESFYEKEVILIEIKPTGEAEKKQIGHVIVLKNVTSFKELDFAKTNFIALVSHELKTPIASIKMSLQLLENQKLGQLNSEQNQLVESIKEDSNRLLKITGELLNMAQVETGNIQLNIQNSKPNDVLNYAINSVKNQAEQKQISLEITAENNLPNIKADNEKTAWVLINFLTNAIRYSFEQAKIEIKILQENNQIGFYVIDKGKGIEDQYQKKIFEKYFQVPNSNKTGTGLGLSICKEFIEAQAGEIGMKSEIGSGSTFYFKLPISA